MRNSIRNPLVSSFLGASLLFASLQGHAQNLDMYGTVSYAFNGAYVTLNAQYIENYASSLITSGSLSLQIWATVYPYSSGTIVGYKMGEAVLGTLQGGYYFQNVSRTVNAYYPPDGLYYMTMVLAEWDWDEFLSQDFHPFSSPEIFGVIGPVTSPVYRFWSDRYRGHFFTISESEKNNIIANLSQDWSYEGISYYAYTATAAETVPLYRFWSDRYRGHFFTISESEKNHIVANLSQDWRYEGVAYHVYPSAASGRSPVYRFWSNRYKHHFFTISESEKNNIIATLSRDWSYEGIAYYVPAPRGASPAGALPTAASEAFAGEGAVKGAVDPAANSSASPTGVDETVFPLSVFEGKVTATVYDVDAGEEFELLSGAESPAEVAVTDVEEGRCYWLEVAVEDPTDGALQVVHASTFERRLDVPEDLGNVSTVRVDAGTGVGNPVEYIQTPAVDGTLTLKLWSATRSVVETREGVVGGETVEFAIPEWNGWHWVGGWRDADDELVMSLWLWHELEE